MKKLILILFLFITSFSYAQITTIKVQGSGGSGSVGTLQQVFNTESGGSILTKLDTINTAGFGLRLLGTSGTSMIINNTAGVGINITAAAGVNVTSTGASFVGSSSGTTAISGSSVSSAAIQGTSTNSFGGNFISTNGGAIHSITNSTTNATGLFERQTASTNTVLPLFQILRATSGTAANGIGNSIEFITEVSDGQTFNSNTLVSKWTDATIGTRTSQFDLTGINSTAVETFANFQTGGIVRVNNLADTLATKAYARSVGGGGGTIASVTGDLVDNTDPVNPVVGLTGTHTLLGNGIIELASNDFEINESGSNRFYLANGGRNAELRGYDNTNDGNRARFFGSTISTDATATLEANFNDGVKVGTVVVHANATTATITQTADSIALNSTLSGTSNGYVWTLANSALGTGYWAAASGGVTSVSGTTNRITSTGGATPVIDISATFEALLGKVANPLSQFAATTSAQLAGVISDEVGTDKLVFNTSPTLVTPILGVATATSINGNTFTTGTYTLTGVAAKTLTFNNSLTLAGTDATTMTFPTTTSTLARSSGTNTFTGNQTFSTIISGIVQTTSTITDANLMTGNATVLTGSLSTARYITVNNIQFRVGVGGSTATVATAGADVFALAIGDNTYTEATSGTSALGGGLYVKTQTFTNGSGATTNFQNVYIGDAPTGGTNNWALNTGATQIRGNLTLGTAGNKINITEGSNGSVGQTVLVSGTKAITITGLTTSGRAFVTLVSPSGVTLTTAYQAVCTTDTLTIQANIAAGTINTADGSTINYFIIN